MVLLTVITVLFSLTCTTLPLHAQWLPQNIGVDSSFRVEYLLGTQTIGNDVTEILISGNDPNYGPFSFPNPIEQLLINFNNSQLVLDGMVELTPFPFVSSRVRGSVSVLDSDRSVTLGSSPAPVANPNPPPNYIWGQLSAVMKPQFWSWEAAGLYNLSYEGVSRYSFVAGYRQESWSYQTSSGQEDTTYLRHNFVSQIPFLGLQSVIFSPSWKARFEVLGSPFMTKKIAHLARDQGFYFQLDGIMTRGGFIELQIEGNVNVASGTWLGLYAQYTYEQLNGGLTGISVDGYGIAIYVPHSYNFYTLKDMWILGLNCSLLF